MSDPRRLLDDPSQLTDEERRLLLAGAAAEPPSSLGTEVWSGLAAKLPSAGAGVGSRPGAGDAGFTGGGATAAAQGGLGALLIKAALAVIAVGALVLGARALRTQDAASSAPPPPALSSSAAEPSPQVTAPLVSVPEPAAPAPPQPPPASPNHAPSAAHSSKALAVRPAPAPSSSASDASEESRVVAAARDALRSDNSGTALALLGQAQQRFGSGVLGQEREALFVEALQKSGQHSAARARGEAFLKNYAHSPYAARIRALTGAN